MMRGTTTDLHVMSNSNHHQSDGNPHTPSLVSPPGSKTPPTATSKRDYAHGEVIGGHVRAGSEAVAVDADALSRALKDFEEAGRQRERTPGGSPSRKRQRVYGDRSVNTLISATFGVIEIWRANLDLTDCRASSQSSSTSDLLCALLLRHSAWLVLWNRR